MQENPAVSASEAHTQLETSSSNLYLLTLPLKTCFACDRASYGLSGSLCLLMGLSRFNTEEQRRSFTAVADPTTSPLEEEEKEVF